jgi:hypothetical protein
MVRRVDEVVASVLGNAGRGRSSGTPGSGKMLVRKRGSSRPHVGRGKGPWDGALGEKACRWCGLAQHRDRSRACSQGWGWMVTAAAGYWGCGQGDDGARALDQPVCG